MRARVIVVAALLVAAAPFCWGQQATNVAGTRIEQPAPQPVLTQPPVTKRWVTPANQPEGSAAWTREEITRYEAGKAINTRQGSRVIIRRPTTVVVRQVRAPVYGKLGHLRGAGHKDVYRAIKSWHPASIGRVDARDARLSSRISGETQMRQEADQNIQKEAKGKDEKIRKDLTTTGFMICLLIAAAFFCTARRLQ